MMVWVIRILQLPMFSFILNATDTLHRISIAVIKPHNQKQLGVESIYFISHVPSQFIIKEWLRRNLMSRTDIEAMGWCCLLTCSFGAHLALSYNSSLPAQGWYVLPCGLGPSMLNISQRNSLCNCHRQPVEVIILMEVPLFKYSSLHQVDKNLINTIGCKD